MQVSPGPWDSPAVIKRSPMRRLSLWTAACASALRAARVRQTTTSPGRVAVRVPVPPRAPCGRRGPACRAPAGSGRRRTGRCPSASAASRRSVLAGLRGALACASAARAAVLASERLTPVTRTTNWRCPRPRLGTSTTSVSSVRTSSRRQSRGLRAARALALAARARRQQQDDGLAVLHHAQEHEQRVVGRGQRRQARDVLGRAHLARARAEAQVDAEDVVARVVLDDAARRRRRASGSTGGGGLRPGASRAGRARVRPLRNAVPGDAGGPTPRSRGRDGVLAA